MSTERDAVLIVYPFCLDHVGHGNIQRLLSIARYLVSEGFDVDLAYQASATAPRNAHQYDGLRRVFAVAPGSWSSDEDGCARRTRAFYDAVERPAAHQRPSAALTGLVRGLIEAEPYRAVVGTYAWTAPIFHNLSRRIVTICDVQDILHEHAAACEAATGMTTTFSLPEATEAFLWRQWDVLVAITPEDENAIRPRIAPHQQLVSARHSTRFMAASAVPGNDNVALFAASDNHSNVQAVKWLLEDVWPEVRRRNPAASLLIAGLICRALPEDAGRIPGVVVLGFQDDLTECIANCGVIVAPYLYGSGLKIKVVEAASSGKAVITTRAGLAGSGLTAHDSIIVEDHAETFAYELARLLSDPTRRAVLADRALDEARALYTPSACYSGIGDAIRSAKPHENRTDVAIPVAALDRVRAVVDDLQPGRIVIWGNGSHTRGLIVALDRIGVTPGLIVDGNAAVATISEEGLTVAPRSNVFLRPTDLILLSSQTFEVEMWRDTESLRRSGVDVLGLYVGGHVSESLDSRLSLGTRIVLGIAPPVSPLRLELSRQPQSIMETSYAAVE